MKRSGCARAPAGGMSGPIASAVICVDPGPSVADLSVVDGVELALPAGMRINVSDGRASSPLDLRRYAEYRFFTAVARYASFVRSIDVELRHPSQPGRIVCAFNIALDDGDSIGGESVGRVPTSTVDVAADRAAALLARRAMRAVSP